MSDNSPSKAPGTPVTEGGPAPDPTRAGHGTPKPAASKAADEGKPEDGTSTATVGRAEKDEAAAKGAEKTQSGRWHRKSDKE